MRRDRWGNVRSCPCPLSVAPVSNLVVGGVYRVDMVRYRPAVLVVLTMCVVMASITCDRASPSLPAAPTPATVSVSGTVFIHDAQGVRPYANASLYGWAEIDRVGGGPAGHATTDSAGRYQFRGRSASRFRIYFGWGAPAYQPCAVTVALTGDVTRDVRAVIDEDQLGARLPQQLLAQTPTLSGVVFEATPDGPRTLRDVRIEVDGTGSGDELTASTLTDSDGRYVVCALELDRHTGISFSKPGYRNRCQMGGADGRRHHVRRRVAPAIAHARIIELRPRRSRLSSSA